MKKKIVKPSFLCASSERNCVCSKNVINVNVVSYMEDYVGIFHPQEFMHQKFRNCFNFGKIKYSRKNTYIHLP